MIINVKILLIYPYCLDDRLQEEDISVVPMGLYYIGALLKEHGYDVEILNFYNLDKTPQKIKAILMKREPEVIGFSILNANRWGAIDIARMAKTINPKVKIVFGGVGATFLWEHFLSHFKVIDYVVIGEGEYTFLNLLQALENQEDDLIETIKGIAFRKNGRIVKTMAAERIQDLDQLPHPAKYFDYQHLSLSRGCPGNCTFCGSPKFWGRKVRFHSPDYFVDQLTLLYQRGITFFFISDDTFTMKKDLVLEICRKILARKLNITWVAISRVNYVDEEILYWMRMAGCVQISYGVESGSEKIRGLLNKNIGTDQIKTAFALSLKYGILARAYFIYGCPGENWKTIQDTIDLILKIKPLSIIFYILDIFPGTRLYEDYVRKFDITDDIWLNRIEDVLCFEKDPELSKELILAFGKKLKAAFYQNLPKFAETIELIDKPEMYLLHADFLSKLAMTFSHGDYAKIEAIKDKDNIAERLYRRSLEYYPDHRAFLGLGILLQKKRAFPESIRILGQGLGCFPESQPMNMCIGISFMNLGDYQKALDYFLKFQDSKEVLFHIANCYQALGETEKALPFMKKYNAM